MSETDSTQQLIGNQRLTQPAIGVDTVSYDGDPAAITGIIAHAENHTAAILVAVAADDTVLQRRLQDSTATVIEVTPGEDSTQAMVTAGKERGMPGVLLHPDPASGEPLDYAESFETFRTTNRYVVPGHVADTVSTGIVAGVIETEHGRDELARLVTGVSDRVDEVLVVGEDAPAVAQDSVTHINATDTPVHACLDTVSRQFSGCEAFVLLGPDTTASDLAELPVITDPITNAETDVVVGRRVNEATQGLTDRLRRAFSMEPQARADTDLGDGPQAFAPRVARRLERATTGDVKRSTLVDAAIRHELDVRVHEYTASPSATDEATPQTAIGSAPTAAQTDTSARADTPTSASTPASTPATEPTPALTDDTPQHLVGPDADTEPVLSVVIPTMNEEEGVGTCLAWVHDAIETLAIPTEIIISDSSTDRTPEIAREYGATVVEPDGEGYGYAYRYAFEQARGEYLVMGDADTTYDFSEIPRLLDELQASGADMVMGSRFDGEIKPGAMPSLHRYVGNPLLTKFLNVFYSAGVSDAHSGFRVFRAEMLDQLNLQSDGMEFASEMIMDASVQGCTIKEVPITYHERVGEETLDSFRDGWRHVRFMLVNAPKQFFSVPAAMMFGIGIFVLALSWTSASVANLTFSVHTTIAGSLLTIVGFQVGSLGLFSTIAADPVKSPSDRLTGWVVDHVRLEHGIAVGTAFVLAGGGYAATMVAQWLTTGTVPLVVPNLLAFTLLVIGIQTIFCSFFLSVLATSK